MQNQWLSECLQGDAILAAPSESNRTPGGVSNTVEEVYVKQCDRSWWLFASGLLR
jgi:hypothetical protein